MRLLMLGTGPFAVPTFHSLLKSPHEVLALVTRPEKPVHTHGRKPTAERNPMREVAESAGLPVHAPNSINDETAQSQIATYQPDLLVVCDYGQILSNATLSLARLGGINLHASLLPKYRGAAPIHWAIYHGESETGITVIHMTPQLDGGPCLAQVCTPIQAAETMSELEARLAEIGAEAVLQTLDALQAGTAQPLPQDQSLATKAPRLKKSDGQINWSRSALEIYNQLRAFKPWPGSFTHWLRPDGEPLRVVLDQVRIADATASAPPGTVLEAGHGKLLLVTGQGALSIERIQPAGKRILTAAEFLNGYPVQVGQFFGG